MKIIHSLPQWLPITQIWTYQQYKYIKNTEQIVLADTKSESPPKINNLFVKNQFENKIINKFTSKFFSKFKKVDYFRKYYLNKYPDSSLISLFGPRGYNDLNLGSKIHITRFAGYDLLRIHKILPIWKERYLELFDKGDAFFVEGLHMQKLLENLKCPKEKIHILEYGAEAQKIKYRYRNSYEKDIINIFLGPSIRPKKGILYALEAIGIVFNDYKIKNIQLQIVGDAPKTEHDLKYKNEVFELLKKMGLSKNYTHYGFVSQKELLKIAYNCDFAVHTSIWADDGDCEGGYPVVLLELMATGLPVISTNHCDIPTVVNNENGYITEEKNVQQIVNAVLDILNTKNLKKKSLEARKTVENKFDWNILGKKIEDKIWEIYRTKY